MTERYNNALQLALWAHAGQVRKGAKNGQDMDLPYITHPVAVSALVQRYDGSEDQCIAALLHDVLEDGGPQWASTIRSVFGESVLSMIEFCTDGTPDDTGKKSPWAERKQAYLAHLTDSSDPGVLVSACDKLHNLRCIHADQDKLGDMVFERFTASREQTLWYYQGLVDVLASKVPHDLAAALSDELVAIS